MRRRRRAGTLSEADLSDEEKKAWSTGSGMQRCGAPLPIAPLDPASLARKSYTRSSRTKA
jgi:hypothetical protein